MKKTVDFYIVDVNDDARFYARREEGFDADSFEKGLFAKDYQLANVLFVNGKEKRFYFKAIDIPKNVSLIDFVKNGTCTFKQFNQLQKMRRH